MEFKKLYKLIIPLLIAAAALGAATFVLPIRARANNSVPNDRLPETVMGEQSIVVGGADVQLSGTGGKLPQVAANGTFVAVVYEQNNNVYLRSAITPTGWGYPVKVNTNQANFPRLAFSSTVTNVVHVVWEGESGQYIRHARCTLAVSLPSCGLVHPIAYTTTGNLKQPDVAVGDGRVHVAWFYYDTDGQIITAYSPDDGDSWTDGVTIGVDGGSNAGEPVLAVAGTDVHLAFKDKTSDPYWYIKYRHLDNNHAIYGGDNEEWTTQTSDVYNYKEMSNPTIAASGSKVYLAWENLHNIWDDTYALVGVENTGTSWGQLKDITSTRVASDAVDVVYEKLSQETATPPTEIALRPSLAVSPTGEFAIVWQQRPEPDCNGTHQPPDGILQNSTSEIFFASHSGNDWGTAGTLADDRSNYSIDPDLAVDTNGTHIVFMKASDGGNCYGGALNGYAVYYRGPFTSFNTSGGVYLPIVLKNS